MKKVITLFIAALTVSAFAQEPVYRFSFDDTGNFTISGDKMVVIYPASEQAKPILESNLQKKIKAANHVSGIMVKTSNSDLAIQEIMNQVSEKTGENIGRIWSSSLTKANPTQILMGANKSATWFFVLSPAPDGDYVLTISYIIEEKDNGQPSVGRGEAAEREEHRSEL